jgi:hypothetical protein
VVWLLLPTLALWDITYSLPIFLSSISSLKLLTPLANIKCHIHLCTAFVTLLITFFWWEFFSDLSLTRPLLSFLQFSCTVLLPCSIFLGQILCNCIFTWLHLKMDILLLYFFNKTHPTLINI